MDFFGGGKKRKPKQKKNPVLGKISHKMRLINQSQTGEIPQDDYYKQMSNIYNNSNKGGLINILQNNSGIIRGDKRLLNDGDIEAMFTTTGQQSNGDNLLKRLGTVFMIGPPDMTQHVISTNSTTYNRNTEPGLMLKYLNNKTLGNGRQRNTRKLTNYKGSKKDKGKSKRKKKS